jgi:peptidoglycan/xylan/chitin deacetylase (PgdA/CDA1 family)
MMRSTWLAERLGPRLGPRALILLYHRVTELDPDPWELAVAPEIFAGQMQVLRKRFTAMSLPALAQGLAEGKLPERAVAVTFDDGYADFADNALPALERFDIPATLFVPGVRLDPAPTQEREYWWDELEQLILLPEELPSQLALSTPQGEWTWKQANGAAEAGSPERTALFYGLWELIHPAGHAQRRAYLEALQRWASIQPQVRPTHRRLSAAELAQVAQHPLVELGGHTITHACLAALPEAEQRREILSNKARLEALTRQPVTSFAYPYGRPVDFSPETVALVRQAGYTCACINVDGAAHRLTDPFLLPRLFVRPEAPRDFAARLKAYFPRRRSRPQ